MISRLSLHNNISRLVWIYNNINTHQRNGIFSRSHHINTFRMILLNFCIDKIFFLSRGRQEILKNVNPLRIALPFQYLIE